MSDFIFNKEKTTKSYKEMETLKLNFLLKQTHNSPNSLMSKNTCLKLTLSSKLEEHKLPSCDNFIPLYLILSFLQKISFTKIYKFKNQSTEDHFYLRDFTMSRLI